MNERMTDPLGELQSESGDSKSMIEAYLLPVYRSRWAVMLLAGLGLVGGFLFGATLPNQYTSVGKVLVRAGERERIRADAVMDSRQGTISNLLNDEVHLLGNEGIYRRVAERVGPAKILAPYDPESRYEGKEPAHKAWMHKLQSWFFKHSQPQHDHAPGARDDCDDCLFSAQRLLMNPDLTKVATARRSNVITVSHTTHNKALAKEVVDAFLEEFDERHREVYHARGVMQLLKQRSDAILKRVATADQDLRKAHDTLGIANLSKERTKLLDAKYDLDWQIRETELQIRLSERELAEMKKRLDAMDPMLPEVRERGTGANPEYTSKQDEIQSARSELSDLHDAYRPGTPVILAKKRRIAELEEELAGIEPEIEVEVVREERPNEAYEELAASVGSKDLQVRNLHTTLDEKMAQRDATVEAMNYLRKCEPQLDDLKMRAEILRGSAEKSAAVMEEKRILEALDQAEISNLVVLDWGSYPGGKSGPNRYQLLLIGGVVGLALGLALAFARSILDSSARSAAEVQAFTGYPVLATVRSKRGLPRGK